MIGYLSQLAVLTLREPQAAAQRILGLGLSANVRWLCLLLVAVATAGVTSVSVMAAPSEMPMPGLFFNPMGLAAFMVVSMSGVAFLTAWFAPMMGGASGRFMDVLILLTWVQTLRAVAQVAMLVLPVLPLGALVALLLALATTVLGIWISVVFVKHALGLTSLIKAFVLLTLAAIAVVLIMSVVWSIVAGPTMVLQTNV